MFSSWFGSSEESLPTPSVTQPPGGRLVPVTHEQYHQQQRVHGRHRDDPHDVTAVSTVPTAPAPAGNSLVMRSFQQSAPPKGGNMPPIEFCNAFVASAGDPMQSEEGRRSRIAHFLDMGVPIDYEDPDGVTALLAAAVSGFANTLDLLLVRGATIDLESSKGGTALIVAAAAGQVDCIARLVAGGAYVDRENATGKTALTVAVQKGAVDAVEALVNVHGADPNRENFAGQTALMLAAETSHAPIATVLCRHGAVPDKENRHGDNAHLVAIRASSPAVMSVMMDAGADPERETSMGLTPLMQAALVGRSDCARLLVRRGARFNRQAAKDGCTPLIQAVMAGRSDAVDCLADLGADLDYETDGIGGGGVARRTTALTAAAEHNQGRCLQLLVRRGASVDKVTADGYTALMRAASFGHVDLLGPLVVAGADPNYESVLGHTPLHCAVLANQSHCASKLIELGAKANHATMLHRPRPPLHRYFYTASTSLTPEANQLQHSGANTLMATQTGDSLKGEGTMSKVSLEQQLKVHRALYGFMALVEQAVAGKSNELLDRLAAVGEGHFAAAPPATSLHAAVETGNAALLRALIGFGADPNAPDRNGNTALHLAVALGKADMVPELVAAGAVVERPNKEGKKAADLCDAAAHPELSRLLGLLGSAGTPSGLLAAGTSVASASSGALVSGGTVEATSLDVDGGALNASASGGSTAAGVMAGQRVAAARARVDPLPAQPVNPGIPAPPATAAALATQLDAFRLNSGGGGAVKNDGGHSAGHAIASAGGPSPGRLDSGVTSGAGNPSWDAQVRMQMASTMNQQRMSSAALAGGPSPGRALAAASLMAGAPGGGGAGVAGQRITSLGAPGSMPGSVTF